MVLLVVDDLVSGEEGKGVAIDTLSFCRLFERAISSPRTSNIWM
jgi:hypothetical protein